MIQLGAMTPARDGVAASSERRARWWKQLWPGSAVPSAIPALDGLRAVAVLLVMSYHAYHPQHGSIPYTSAFDMLGFGNTGVQLFFVLSGFLLCIPYARWLFNLQTRPLTLLFYRRRLLRVGPAYWTNIVILFLFSSWSLSGLLTLLGRIVYLHNLFSYDLTQHAGVLWTMCVEVQFYAVLPLLAGTIYFVAKAISRYIRNSQLALFLAVVGILGSCEALSVLCKQLIIHDRWRSLAFLTLAPDALFDPNSMPYWLGVFAVGMACGFLYVWATQIQKLSHEQSRVLRALASIAFVAGVLFALGIALSPLAHIQIPYVDFVFGDVYGLALIGVTLGARWFRLPFETPVLRFIGYISYSIYLWHLIVLENLEPHLTMLTDPHAHMVISFALDAAISIPLAYVSYLVTERPFFSLRLRSREAPASLTSAPTSALMSPSSIDARSALSEHGASVMRAPAVAPAFAPRPATEFASSGFPTHAAGRSVAHPGYAGQVIGGYRLERELGGSSHGMAFYARRMTADLVTWDAAMTSNTVVLKSLWPPSGSAADLSHPEFERRFARLTAELHSVCGVLIPSAAQAGVAQFIGWGGAPQQPYLVRAFISGYSLAQRVAFERRGLQLLEVASYIARIATALDYAHERQVTHGACTLENVLISQDGKLTITDFGLERLLAPLPGHPPAPPRLELARYFAPERLENPQLVTVASDMYSLGVTLHILLSGVFPFDGATPEDLRQAQRSGQRAPLASYRTDITAEMENVVARALAPRPQNRFASAGALASAFTASVERATGKKVFMEPSQESFYSPAASQTLANEQAARRASSANPFSSPEQSVNRASAPSGWSGAIRGAGLPPDLQEESSSLDPTLVRMPRVAGPASSAPAIDRAAKAADLHGAPRRLTPVLLLDGVISLMILVAAFVMNLHLLPSISLYFDEAMSVETARQSPGVLASYLWGYQNQMPLYYALLSVWVHLLSALGITATELLVRLPSVVFAALASVVIYLFGQRFWSRMAGLAAAALYVLNTLQLYHAQKARAYPLQLLMLCVSWYALFLVLSGKDRRRRVWLIYISSTVLAVYAQPYSALVVAAQVVAFAWYGMVPGLWRTHARSALRSVVVSWCAIVALSLPLGADFALHGQPNSFVPIAQLKDLPNFFLRMQLGAPSHQYALDFVRALGIFSALSVGASALWNLPQTNEWLRRTQAGSGPLAIVASSLEYLPPGAGALVAWVAVPMALAFFATQPYLNLHLFYWRYLVVVIPPLCLLVGVGVSAIRLPKKWLGGSVTGALVAQGILTLALVLLVFPETIGFYAQAEVSDFRTPAAWINSHYGAGDSIVCLPGRMCSVPLEYYLTNDFGPARLTSSSPGAWLWVSQQQVRVDPAYVEAFSARQPRVFFVDAPLGMSATQLAQSQQVRAWLDAHERLVAACAALTVTVRLYEAGSPVPGQADAPAPHC